MQNFSYHAPETLAEACALMAEAPAESRFLAGGTDLYLALEHQPQPVTAVIDLKRIPGLDGIDATPDGGWRIGALTRMATLEHHAGLAAALPALIRAASVVGGPPVRNRATLGGNLCNASPAADTATPLLALEAQLEVSDGVKIRWMELRKLWSAPRVTTLAPGEVLTAVVVPPQTTPGSATGNAFTRLTRSAMDIALVNAAVKLNLDAAGSLQSLNIALGAVGPTVLSVPNLQQLAGQPFNPGMWDAIQERAENAAQPISDVRASAQYRLEMAGLLARQAAQAAYEMAQGEQK